MQTRERLPPAQRYALVLVDFSVAFTDPAQSPLGAECESVIAAAAEVLAAVRQRGWPVVFTTVAYSNPTQARMFRTKLPSLEVLKANSPLVAIDPRLAPQSGETVLVKHWASAFFATDLASQLRAAEVDGVIVTGLTTSGCVRATAVDALQYDFNVVVVKQAVGDRDAAAHNANLVDLQTKYADVMELTDVLALMQC